MKGLILLLLFGAAVWYGWKVYPTIVERRPAHEAVIENQSDATLTRIRLRVDGQTLVREKLDARERATLPFRVNRDATFQMEWEDPSGERSWNGGMVPAGPMTQRHVFVIDDEGQVLYRAENR